MANIVCSACLDDLPNANIVHTFGRVDSPFMATNISTYYPPRHKFWSCCKIRIGFQVPFHLLQLSEIVSLLGRYFTFDTHQRLALFWWWIFPSFRLAYCMGGNTYFLLLQIKVWVRCIWSVGYGSRRYRNIQWGILVRFAWWVWRYFIYIPASPSFSHPRNFGHMRWASNWRKMFHC